MPSPPVLPWDRALDAVSGVDALEQWSPATGSALLVVDVAGAPPDALAVLGPLVARLPCVTVAVGAEDRCFDLVTDGEDLERVAATVAAHPAAAVALVQLLRATEGADVPDALFGESVVYGLLQSGADFRGWLAARPPTPPSDRDRPLVRVDRRGDVLDVVLDRPDRHNAFSAAMRDELVAALQLAAADPDLRVMLSGAGASFCSGGDLTEFGTVTNPVDGHLLRSTRNAGWWLWLLAAQVEARVHGACIGAGVELPAFCGRVVAAPDAFFQLPEVGMGLVPGAGGTVSIPRRVGRQRAAWLALTGARLGVDDALAWGLIDEIS